MGGQIVVGRGCRKRQWGGARRVGEGGWDKGVGQGGKGGGIYIKIKFSTKRVLLH